MFEEFRPTTTVADYLAKGYRGLRIPRCPTCRKSTWATFSELGAEEAEDLFSVALRIRCSDCGERPTGLAVVASAGRA